MLIPAAVAQHASQFWPDVERALTAVAAVGANAAAWWGRRNHGINQEVKIMLNGELHAKLERLEQLTSSLESAQHDLASLGQRHSDNKPPTAGGDA